jgi:hypothetical protein
MKVFAPSAPWRSFQKFAKIALTFTMVSGAQAGFLDLMKGESSSPAPSFQRVAFVGSAKVREVRGEVERLAGIDLWKPLKAGTELQPGDMVRTRNGTALLRMNESTSFVKITPQTILRLVELERTWDKGVLSGKEEKKGFVVRSCRGNAYHRAPGQEWQSIEVNSVLAAGSEVRTDPETVLDLFHTSRQRPVRIQGPVVVKLSENAFANRVLVQPELVAAVPR